jgi:hypothetical protein
MLRTFNLNATSEAHNWRELSQKTDFIRFDPTLTGFTGTAPTDNVGMLQQYGPLVYLYLRIKGGAAFGWGAASTIDIPVPPYTTTVTTVNQYLNQVIRVSTGAAINTDYPAISNSSGVGRITLATAVSSVGGPTEVVLTGWYIRD